MHNSTSSRYGVPSQPSTVSVFDEGASFPLGGSNLVTSYYHQLLAQYVKEPRAAVANRLLEEASAISQGDIGVTAAVGAQFAELLSSEPPPLVLARGSVDVELLVPIALALTSATKKEGAICSPHTLFERIRRLIGDQLFGELSEALDARAELKQRSPAITFYESLFNLENMELTELLAAPRQMVSESPMMIIQAAPTALFMCVGPIWAQLTPRQQWFCFEVFHKALPLLEPWGPVVFSNAAYTATGNHSYSHVALIAESNPERFQDFKNVVFKMCANSAFSNWEVISKTIACFGRSSVDDDQRELIEGVVGAIRRTTNPMSAKGMILGLQSLSPKLVLPHFASLAADRPSTVSEYRIHSALKVLKARAIEIGEDSLLFEKEHPLFSQIYYLSKTNE